MDTVYNIFMSLLIVLFTLYFLFNLVIKKSMESFLNYDLKKN